MDKTLTVSISRTFDGKPLAVVDNLPGGFAELRPAELRALAAALQRVASDCEARSTKGKHWMPARRDYPLIGAAAAASTAKPARTA
jgi:hypothetical protein